MKKTLCFVLLLSAATAYALTARFTGNKKFVKTPAGRDAISCEYDLNGNKFWRDFTDLASCPATAETD